MVEMAVGEEQVGINRLVGLEQFVAKWTQAAAAVQDHDALTAAQLETGRIAAITRGSGTRAGDAAAHAPELHAKAHFSSLVGRLAIERRQTGRFVHATLRSVQAFPAGQSD